MAIPIIRRDPIDTPEMLEAFSLHVEPPTNPPGTPDAIAPEITFGRQLTVGHQLPVPGEEPVDMWVIRDTVNDIISFPSPTIRVRRGQVVHTLMDVSQNTHTIHHHGIEPSGLNDGVGHASFEVSSSYAYQWQPRHPGTYLYHCHKNTPLHFEMGLYGLIIVDPKVPGAPFADGGPGFAAAHSPRTGHVIPYDVEVVWAVDDVDRRWHALGHDAFMMMGGDPNDPASFSVDGILHDFRPDVFIVSGVARGVSDPTPFLEPPVAVGLRVGQTGLIRLVNAAYQVIRVTLGLPATVIAMDGYALGASALTRYSRPFDIPASTPFPAEGLATARRWDLILKPARRGVYPVTIDYFDWVTRRRNFTARTFITVD